MKGFISIVPMGAVRITRRGIHVDKYMKRYLSYKQEISLRMKAMGFEPVESMLIVKIRFYMPVPKSYSKKKRESLLGQPHGKKPDSDNLIKSVFDAANSVLWKDDAQVFRVEAEKIYSEQPGIDFEVIECF